MTKEITELDEIVQMVAMHGSVTFIYNGKTYSIKEGVFA
jgi:hypothetical protein